MNRYGSLLKFYVSKKTILIRKMVFDISVPWLLINTIIALSVWFFVIRNYSFFTERNVKFVRGIPVLGSLWRSIVGLEHFTHTFERLYRRFPNERIVGYYDIGDVPKYMIRDVELIKQIAIKDFDHFVNHNFFVDENVDSFGRSLFVMRNQRWRDMRSKLSPAFTGTIFINFFHIH